MIGQQCNCLRRVPQYLDTWLHDTRLRMKCMGQYGMRLYDTRMIRYLAPTLPTKRTLTTSLIKRRRNRKAADCSAAFFYDIFFLNTKYTQANITIKNNTSCIVTNALILKDVLISWFNLTPILSTTDLSSSSMPKYKKRYTIKITIARTSIIYFPILATFFSSTR